MGCCASCDRRSSCSGPTWPASCGPGMAFSQEGGSALFTASEHLSLDAVNGMFSALEPCPMDGGNAARVCAAVYAGVGGMAGTLFLQGGNDLANYTTIGNVALNGLGYYTFQVGNIAFAHVRLFVMVNPGGGGVYTGAMNLSVTNL